MTSIRYFFISALAVAALVSACGPAGGDECTKDTDCKGSRVCQVGSCVDPLTSSGGGNGGTGGGSGSGGGGGNSTQACNSGRDSDCPNGFWCQQKVCTATTLKKVGDTCQTNTDCAGGACLVRNTGDIAGYCSKRCESFSSCPSFWDCKDLSNAAGTYCVQN